jgi:hypothetical protein
VEPLFTLVVFVVVAALFIWGGIVALATPTVAYRFDRRFHLASPAFDHALSSVLATRMAHGNRFVQYDPRMTNNIPVPRLAGHFL